MGQSTTSSHRLRLVLCGESVLPEAIDELVHLLPLDMPVPHGAFHSEIPWHLLVQTLRKVSCLVKFTIRTPQHVTFLEASG